MFLSVAKTFLDPNDLQNVIETLAKDHIKGKVATDSCKTIDFEKLNEIKCNIIGVFGRQEGIVDLLEKSFGVITPTMCVLNRIAKNVSSLSGLFVIDS